jgi:hypothetical protein
MAGVIVEVRCPSCDSLAVARKYGIGRLIAGLCCFIGIGVPIFIYVTWRAKRIADAMKCRLCGCTFALSAQHVNFPRGLGAVSATPSEALRGSSSPVLPVVVACSAVIGLVLAFWLASTIAGFLAARPSESVAGVQAVNLAATVCLVASDCRDRSGVGGDT